MESFNETEAIAFLGFLFPGGLKDPELIKELCPEGWRDSALSACFHPPPERQYEEYLAMRRNFERLRKLSGRKGRADELRRMRKRLDRDALAAMREARAGPPPATVRAYAEIYGRFPKGWPPDPYTPVSPI